ncbi:MAG: hypothetical protein IJ784_13570 [Ruminiclostridium sp.]|nr:hypothetical protein [Ruminiclostridium sp.]
MFLQSFPYLSFMTSVISPAMSSVIFHRSGIFLPFVCVISNKCLADVPSPNTETLCSPLFTTLPSLFHVSSVATFVAFGF